MLDVTVNEPLCVLCTRFPCTVQKSRSSSTTLLLKGPEVGAAPGPALQGCSRLRQGPKGLAGQAGSRHPPSTPRTGLQLQLSHCSPRSRAGKKTLTTLFSLLKIAAIHTRCRLHLSQLAPPPNSHHLPKLHAFKMFLPGGRLRSVNTLIGYGLLAKVSVPEERGFPQLVGLLCITESATQPQGGPESARTPAGPLGWDLLRAASADRACDLPELVGDMDVQA